MAMMAVPLGYKEKKPKKRKRCEGVELSGEDPTHCALPNGHKGPHRSAKWNRYDENGSALKHGKQWLVWTGRNLKEV